MTQSKLPTRHFLPSQPDTVVWGFLGPSKPVLHIQSGDIVDIDTLNPVGMLGEGESAPVFFKQHGFPMEGVGQQLTDVMESHERYEGPHILTGPIYVEDAKPGDVLEVRVLDVTPRAPYFGVNFSFPGAGSLPDLLTEPWVKVLPFELSEGHVRFAPGIDIPLNPFMGVMAVAPTKKVSSVPPGTFGGNIDLKYLTPGGRLYLPVQVEGGLFYTGDGHLVQGNGEVNLTALEASLKASFQFVLHKNCARTWPVAETADYYFTMGLDTDLDEAARIAVEQAVQLIAAQTGMSLPQAYSLASLVLDLEVTQNVDGVKGIHGKLAKRLFRQIDKLWWGPQWPGD